MEGKATPQSKTSGPVPAAKTAHRASSEGPLGAVPAVLPAAGNQAIGRLLQAAAGDAGAPLDQGVRGPLEQKLGVNLGSVRVHEGRNAEAAAQSVDARAYTVGSDVYLGPEAQGLSADARAQLLTHEAVHTVQQGGSRVPLEGPMPVSSPNDAAEREAREIAQGSPALALRDAMRVSHVAPHIQRDITGSKKWPQGEFKINFKKNDGKVAGDVANETGTVTFSPSATAPESDHITFFQLARTFDTTTSKEFDWTGTAEANRNKVQTTRDVKKNIAPGFFIDQIHAGLTPRTKKSDPAVSAVYPFMQQEGKRKGATRKDAILGDTPGFAGPLKFSLVSVAKGLDNGTVYGTVLWGFETFLDKGVAKIKNEYKSFRVFQGETFDAALQKFNEFYKNPGTPGAPTK
jgi:Domain of unknown function (DUF4157)